MAIDELKLVDKQRLQMAIASIVLGVFLLALKYYAYFLTQSSAIFSDALESIVNVVAAVVLCMVILVSIRPPDRDHPYGHGKLESMAGAFEGGAVLFAGILILIEATERFLHGVQLRELNIGLLIVSLAGFLNGLMGFLLKKQGKAVGSQAMVASGTHLLSDCWTSIGILVGLLLVQWTDLQWLDPCVAVLVGLLLIYEGGKIMFRSGSDLMDAEDKDLLEKLIVILQKNLFPGMIRIHHTRVMRSGRLHHIDLHMVVPEFWSILEGHDKSLEFEQAVLKDYPFEGEIHFHLDPCLKNYCKVCDLKDCPIRIEAFDRKIPLNLEELVSQDEPELEEILDDSN